MILYRTVARLSAAPRTCTTAAGPQPPLHFLPGMEEICSETDDAPLMGGGTMFRRGAPMDFTRFNPFISGVAHFYPFLSAFCKVFALLRWRLC